MSTPKVVRSYLSPKDMYISYPIELNNLLGDNKWLRMLYKKGTIDTELVFSFNGKCVLKAVGRSADNNRTLGALVDYIYMHCLKKYNYSKNMEVVSMNIVDLGENSLAIELTFVDSPKVSIFFENFKYKTSFNFNIGEFDYTDLENMLIDALASIIGVVNTKGMKLHKIEYWFKEPLRKEDKAMFIEGGYIGFRESEVKGEYVISYLV